MTKKEKITGNFIKSFYKKIDINTFILTIAILILILDQLTKYLIKTKLYLYESIPIIKNIFHITYTTNAGAGFGILQNYRWFFVVFTVIFIIAIYIYYSKYYASIKKDFYLAICIALLLGGALGNFYDRLRFGYVVDFLDFRIWPTFNVADSAVSVGAVLLIIWLWKK